MNMNPITVANALKLLQNGNQVSPDWQMFHYACIAVSSLLDASPSEEIGTDRLLVRRKEARRYGLTLLVLLEQNLGRKKQGQVGQQGATCVSSNKYFTNQRTNQPTDQRTQPVIEVLCRT